MEISSAGEPGYAEAVAGFNLITVATPELAATAAHVGDVVEAVGEARRRGLRLWVQGAGHGGMARVDGGLLLSMRKLDQVDIDPVRRIASLGAGARWDQVVSAAAAHGLAAVTGSSPRVGVAGYLLGGGLGPLARSHGVSSDYLLAAELVDAAGELRRADAELLWALRGGGKLGFGVLTRLEVQLVALPALFGGALHFAAADVDPVLRAWLAWTRTCDPRVSTSVAVLPGGAALHLRFAFPGEAAEGERLAAPLRRLGHLEADSLRAMSASEVPSIHADPTEPCAVLVSGAMLREVDPAVLDRLRAAQAEVALGFELRHFGAATRRDVAEGSSVSGRQAGFGLGLVGIDPTSFAALLPRVRGELLAALAPWTSEEGNPNFHGPSSDPRPLYRAEVWQRLQRLKQQLDPERRFG